MSGRNNLWLVPSDGGWPMQLTVSEERQTQPTWSPDGKWIAYISITTAMSSGTFFSSRRRPDKS